MREWGEKGKAEEIERRVWEGMARVSVERKETERREWLVLLRLVQSY